MIVGNHKSLIPFQKGILLTNKSLNELQQYVYIKYNVEYILTSRLNQDVVENFFSYIRGMGGQNDHPNPLDFKYRLKWYILGKNSTAVFTENKNTEDTTDQCLLQPLEVVTDILDNDTVCLTQSMFSNLNADDIISEKPTYDENNILEYSFIDPFYPEIQVKDSAVSIENEQLLQDFEVKQTVHEDALKYIAGYVAYKFKGKYNLGSETKNVHIDDNTKSWLNFIS